MCWGVRLTTTPEQALRIATAYVAEHRLRRVTGLLEDADDYLVQLRRPRQVQLGPGYIFISKQTGDLRHAPLVPNLEKVLAMTPVVR